MIGQRADDVAFTHLTSAPATGSNPMQFTGQPRQPLDAGLNRFQMTAGNLMRLTASHVRIFRKPGQIADRLDGKPQITGMADEGKPLKFGS